MIRDLEQLILKFAGCHYPMESIEVDEDSSQLFWRLNDEFKGSFLQKWTPTHCNVLRWIYCRDGGFLWHYDKFTKLNPNLIWIVSRERERLGYVPIFPGNRQCPNSRIRFNPIIHVNDRYFR